MKKILFIASIEKHILRFHLPFLKWFYDHGYEVHVACNGLEKIPNCHVQHLVNFVRRPFSLLHIRAFFQLRRILSSEKFVLVHCHTAVSSVITRLAAQKFREEYGLKVLYTAHGFHFFKGSPLSYWLLYYPVEKFFSKYLDCLITINREDYELATTKFHCKDVRRISGMGVNPSRFANVSEDQKMDFRNSLGIKKNDFVLVYVAEFIDRKNHAFLIENAEKIRQLMPDVKIIFSGRGMLMRKMQSLASKLRVLDMIIFLGFRNDVNVVISSSDIGISVSKQEGLGLHLVECMFCNLPVIASQDRGHREIIQNGFNGYIFEQGDIDSFIDLVNKLKHDQALYKMLSKNAVDSSKRFQLQVALKELGDIYMHYTR